MEIPKHIIETQLRCANQVIERLNLKITNTGPVALLAFVVKHDCEQALKNA